MCWDVMMVGDRWPSVSLVFTRAPPKKNPPLWKMCWLSPGCVVAWLCSSCPCSVVGWNHVCGFQRGGGHHHSTSVFPLCVIVFPLILLVYLYIYVVNLIYILFVIFITRCCSVIYMATYDRVYCPIHLKYANYKFIVYFIILNSYINSCFG